MPNMPASASTPGMPSPRTPPEPAPGPAGGVQENGVTDSDTRNDGGGTGLGGAVRRGLGFSLLNNALSRLGTVVTGIVLARLLSPSDYGDFAVALVVLNALLSINELGVSLAIVRWPGEPRLIAPTVQTLSTGFSIGLYLLTLVLAPTIADLLGSPAATGLVRVLALSMIVDGVASVPAALLTRAFQQGRRMIADLAALAVNTGVTIGLAALGHGAWSLVIGYLAGNLTTSIMIFAFAGARIRFGFDRHQVRGLLDFGLPLAGSSLLVFGVLNIHYVVVGAVLGPVALGFYMLAFNLSSWPVNMFSLAVRRVAMPAFARLSTDRKALTDAFARSIALLMAATLPVCAIIAVLAGPLIHIVYGPKWDAAADALRWLAVLGACRVAAELAYDLLVGAGRSRAVFAVQGSWLAALAPALFIGARAGGIGGLAFAQAAVAVVVVGPAFIFAIARADVGPIAALRYCGRPVVATTVLVLVMVGLGTVVRGDLARLLLLPPAGLAACAVPLFPLRRLVRPGPHQPSRDTSYGVETAEAAEAAETAATDAEGTASHSPSVPVAGR
ncbi:lipopolysaccharide biosynthesis protein [Frankia sp. Cj3]|uniref:lipopolysaccharide biosynthesis protein n=2 Tax=unclassified Frankia TaxID=2632575 RepID=UPI001EF3DD8E|nr:lipopolysaccharide biosynthesis protein [Frankia sp. Cj3]